jgi:ribosomal protein S12 methylthiotransferase accessory factor YcaO
MRIDEVRESDQEPERDRNADVLARFQALRELCQGLLELPAGEDRDTGGEILAVVAMAEASLDLLAAHIHRLYPDPNEGA